MESMNKNPIFAEIKEVVLGSRTVNLAVIEHSFLYRNTKVLGLTSLRSFAFFLFYQGDTLRLLFGDSLLVPIEQVTVYEYFIVQKNSEFVYDLIKAEDRFLKKLEKLERQDGK
jgi:hypothetical protein